MSTWDRPLPKSLDPQHQKLYDDPPADIARAFGLRPFFLFTGAHTPFRIGLFQGLGWMLAPHHCRVDGTNCVRIYKLSGRIYRMTFCRAYHGPDNLDPMQYDDRTTPIDAELDALTVAYAQYLGLDQMTPVELPNG